jgi:hypothetical protein
MWSLSHRWPLRAAGDDRRSASYGALGVSAFAAPTELIVGGFPSTLVQMIALLEPTMLTLAAGPNSMVILFSEPAKSRLEHLPVMVRALLLPTISALPPTQSRVAV